MYSFLINYFTYKSSDSLSILAAIASAPVVIPIWLQTYARGFPTSPHG